MKKTTLGYATFFCPQCRSPFHERTGTPFHDLEVPTDSVLLVVFWQLWEKLSLRGRAEVFFARDCVFPHETIRDWKARFAPLASRRSRKAGY